ncbi:Lig_chan domain-containing protein/SBP_bac_3 domain-containing protein/ANF_receptor domain-containing protein [Heracleum sosnowskyi]|uniref:Glutamate receptor n=1 Tax=Heracleum sosnowskyi TaxID=360622 RepID=A0AAD8HRI7_9APIA|nr:Lig_chan domain-containing protein/SBP_bac_3 domain-containing protein/ANF_receptor domain-containing protein [Heracleum sosnowskyi]
MNIVSFLIFLVISFWWPLFHAQVRVANGSLISPVVNHESNGRISIGAIFDETSRPGKEAKVAVEMAIDDFSSSTNPYLFLYSRNSQGKPGRAAVAAKELISTHGVKLIMGAHTRGEASAIAEVASEEAQDVPVFLSFADLTPKTLKFPCVLQATPDQKVQMNAIAAIIQSWGLLQVTLIYENVPTLSTPEIIVSQLSQALEQSGGELSHIFTLTSFSLDSLQKELIQLKEKKCRVFVIHATLESGYRLYQNAKKLNMTGDGFLWIATNSITDLFHSVSPKNMSLMQGIIGTKTYFHENLLEFQNFRKRFQSHFKNIYPDEEYNEPGIFALQAYDVIQRISAADFSGSGAEFQCVNWTISPAKVVEIVNVVGKSYQSGYWTEGLGFSETLDDEAFHHTSMEILKEVLWLAQPWHTERQRRILAGRSEPIRVGVPGHSIFKQFVKVDTDPRTNKTSYEGFSIKVFEEVMKIANKDLTYNYVPFGGPTYDDMVKEISLGNFTAVAGDVTILEARHKFADFSQPYTESGMVLIVPIQSRLPSRMWLFMKPFTTKMWGLIVAITIYNGFTVWLIERSHNDEFRSGPVWNQIGTLYWLAFSTLFTLRGDRLHSNLSRMAMVVWLFVALIITQSYTASLSSMLTAQMLEPSIKDVATLKKMNATVGYCKGSFLKSYIIGTLGFDPANIRKYPSTAAYAKALNTKEIAGIFLEVPPAKVFLAQYCKSFIKTEKTFKVGGFGFAFEKGFPLLPAINNAIMNITESGELLKLEQKYINSEECVDADTVSNEEASIGLNSFSILFMLTGCTSTFALVMFVIRHLLYSESEHTNVKKALIKRWRRYRRQTSGRVINVESPRIPPDAPYLEARQSFSTASDVESVVDHQDAPHLR